MFPADDITADLPAPRDDEPESLRRDIADELIDHLQSSLQRELHRSSPESGGRESAEQSPVPAAAARVLARFGDPSAIARTLWWDAMQEKVMTQRLTLLMASTAAAACIAGCVLLWQMTQRQADVQAAALAGQQSLLQSVMAHLDRLDRPVKVTPNDSGWAPVSILLVSAEDIAAQVQATASISGGPVGRDPLAHPIRKSATPDAAGRIDFGTVPLGQYTIAISVESSGLQRLMSVIVGPEGAADVEVICPTTPPKTATPQFGAIDIPPEMRDLLFVLTLGKYTTTVHGEQWESMQEPPILLVQPDGHVLGELTRPEQVTRIRSQRSTSSGVYNQPEFEMYQIVLMPGQPTIVANSTLKSVGAVHIADRVACAAGRIVESPIIASWSPQPELQHDFASDAFWKIDLPDELIRFAVETATVLDLRLIPEGMTLVELPVADRDSVRVGDLINVVTRPRLSATFGPASQDEMVVIAANVEAYNVQIFRRSPRTDMLLIRQTATLLVTPEQATAIETAKAEENIVVEVRMPREPKPSS